MTNDPKHSLKEIRMPTKAILRDLIFVALARLKDKIQPAIDNLQESPASVSKIEVRLTISLTTLDGKKIDVSLN